MSKIRAGNMTEKTFQVYLDGTRLLKVIPRVEVQKGHPALKYWPVANEILAIDPRIRSVGMETRKGMDQTIVTVMAEFGSDLDMRADDIKKAVGPLVVKGIQQFAQHGIKEKELIAGLGGDSIPKLNPFLTIVDQFIRDQFIPILRKPTEQGGVGHDTADLAVVGMRNLQNTEVPGGPVQTLVSLVLKGGCVDCQTSVAATLKMGTQMLQHGVFNKHAGGKAQMAGFDVTPSSGGSPCYTARYQRSLIDAPIQPHNS